MNQRDETATTTQQQASIPQALLGIWSGEVALGATPVAMVLRIEHGESGLAVTGEFPQHYRKDIAFRDASFDAGTLRFATANMGDYAGQLSADGQRIVGEFAKGELRFPSTLQAGEMERPVHRRPQLPQPPFPYAAESVTIDNVAAGVRLAGTYTLPAATSVRAALLLVTGSGAMDRDETVFGNKPLFVLADHLSRHGYAVLRLDDRGVGESTGDRKTLTIADEADDMALALRWLRARPELENVPVGILGHSMGALTATMVAARIPEVAFLVTLAGAGLAFPDVMAERECQMWRNAGRDADTVARHGAYTRALYANLRDRGLDEPIDAAQITALAEQHGATATAVMKDAGDWISRYNERWFRSVIAPLPAHWLAQVRAPYLALTGAKDIQVTPQENLAAMAATLAAAGHTDYTTRELADLNHLFQTCATGAPYEYPVIEETFAPVALEAIRCWLDARFGMRAA